MHVATLYDETSKKKTPDIKDARGNYDLDEARRF
jgi:hypothetical protein